MKTLVLVICLAGAAMTSAATMFESPPTFLFQFGHNVLPPPIAGFGLSSTGDVFVGGTSAVYKFSNGGQFIGSFGSHGAGPGQFDGAADAAIAPNGDIFVADQNNRRIEVFDSNFQYQREWSGGFSYIAIDPSGQYLVGRFAGSTKTFTVDGTLVSTWPLFGNGIGVIGKGFAIGPSGHVYMGISGDVWVYDLLGNEITHWPIAAARAFCPVAVDAHENVYVGIVPTDTTVLVIHKYTSDGILLTRFGARGAGPGQFGGQPGDIVVDSQDGVFAQDEEGTARIEKFGPRVTPTHKTSWGQLKAIFRE